MNKKVKVLLITVILAISMLPLNVCAAENGNFQLVQGKSNQEAMTNVQHGINDLKGNPYSRVDTIYNATLTTSIAENGIMVAVNTSTNVIASEIGMENLLIEEKTLLGWKTVVDCTDFKKDSDIYVAEATYYGAEVGKKYRVSCTHYAIMNGVKQTVYNEMSPILF